MKHLDELDGKEVHITLSSTDFDRRVRASLDRLHRRQQIAEN